MNTIAITGRLTADPELRRTQSGVSVLSYTLAVKRPRVKDTTDFIDVVSWRNDAEFLAKYAHKGSLVAVAGALTTRKWQDKHGNNRTSFEVVSDNVELLGGKTEGGNKPNIDVDPEEFEEITGDDSMFG